MGVHDHGSIVWDEFIGMGLRSWRCRPMTGSGLPPDLCFPYSGYVEAVADPLV